MSDLDWIAKANRFEANAHKILGVHEGSKKSRVVLLEEMYNRLGLLSLKQDDLFRQALRCAENGLYRAAHVMAWAACMDYIQKKLAEDGLQSVRRARPTWQGSNIDEMAEYVPERQLVEVLKDVGFLTKNQVAALVGLLQRRNECAHPTAYLPGLNETLGYLSELLQRIETLSKARP
jgi:hypothetical protein